MPRNMDSQSIYETHHSLLHIHLSGKHIYPYILELFISEKDDEMDLYTCIHEYKKQDQLYTFKLNDSRNKDICSKSCRKTPNRLMGMRTEPPAFTESMAQEQIKASFSISSKLSSPSADFVDSSQLLLSSLDMQSIMFNKTLMGAIYRRKFRKKKVPTNQNKDVILCLAIHNPLYDQIHD